MLAEETYTQQQQKDLTEGDAPADLGKPRELVVVEAPAVPYVKETLEQKKQVPLIGAKQQRRW